MEQQERLIIETKLNEILSKIPDGKERYHNSALTHTIVDSLLHGHDPVILIGQLIEMYEKQENDYREFLRKLINNQ